jgi:flagella basal body P-ring formation protein FlgA
LFYTLRATAIKISRSITLGALLFCAFAASAQPLVSVFKSVHATGDELRLSRGAILKKIREKLEGELSIVPEYRAPKRVSVDRVSFKLSAERLSRYVEDAALAYGPIGSLKLSRVKVPRLSALKVPEGATLSLTASAGHIPSRVPVDLELRGSGRLLRRQRLLVELDYLQDVVVLTNQLAVGSILKRSDLTMVAVSAQKLPPSVIVSPDEIVGAKLRQSIGPKIPLRKAWLWVPPLIKRGAKVMMTFKKGNLTISAEGQALSDGAKGDVIQIKNIQSKKTVSGRVVAPNQVEVEF